MSRPCLQHAYTYDENGDEELYVCSAADGHEDAHEFVPADSVRVQAVNPDALLELQNQ